MVTIAASLVAGHAHAAANNAGDSSQVDRFLWPKMLPGIDAVDTLVLAVPANPEIPVLRLPIAEEACTFSP